MSSSTDFKHYSSGQTTANHKKTLQSDLFSTMLPGCLCLFLFLSLLLFFLFVPLMPLHIFPFSSSDPNTLLTSSHISHGLFICPSTNSFASPLGPYLARFFLNCSDVRPVFSHTPKYSRTSSGSFMCAFSILGEKKRLQRRGNKRQRT